MAQRNGIMSQVIAHEITKSPTATKVVLAGGVVVAVVVGATIIYVGYKTYKFVKGLGGSISTALNPVRSAWEKRPKIIFKGMEQGGAVVAGTDDLQILGGLIQ